jgi:hypothetical protein
MQMHARNPAATYRRIELDARIEASGRADLTRICLEESLTGLGQVVAGFDRGLSPPVEPLARAQSIMVWLAQSVAKGHPLEASLKQFYGGLARQIGASILQPDAASLRRVMSDIKDLMEAAA